MGLLLKIYSKLLNGVPEIRQRYEVYRAKQTGIKKVKAWIYLGVLNIRYYVFHDRSLKKNTALDPDSGKRVINGSESELSFLERQNISIEKLCKYDIVSFDVFDTLILRCVEKPEDVFYEIQKSLSYPGLKNVRKEAEKKARENRYRKYGDYEVSFEDIWQEVSLLTGIPVREGMKLEWEAELKFCFANPFFEKIVSELRKHHVKMIICSDMYFNAEYIKKLLYLKGYPEFDAYYISSDHHKAKHDGKLYEEIRRIFGEELSYIHIGDNLHSDIAQAKKKHFDAIHYKDIGTLGNLYRAKDMSHIISSMYSGIVNGYLHNGMNRLSTEFEFGFIYGGLFATGYCQFIHQFVETKKIDKILFLSRDGDVLKKVYEVLYPEDKGKCQYAYWSRLSSIKLAAKALKSHYVERMLLHKANQEYTLQSVFETMDLNDLLDVFIDEYSNHKYHKNSIFKSAVVKDVIAFINDHWQDVCEHYSDEILEGKSYYQRLLGDAKSVVAVDVGWVGSGALILDKMLRDVWHIECQLYGLLAGTCSGNSIDHDCTAIESATEKLVSYLFSASANRDLWKFHDAAKGHNMIVELLLSSPEYSFRGFKRDEKGSYMFNQTIEKIDAHEIQKGILTFVKLFKNHPWSNVKISGRDAFAPIALLYENNIYIDSVLKKSEIVANVE